MVGSTLPVHVMLAGLHDPALATHLVRGLNVSVHGSPDAPVPRWAAVQYRGTFVKLAALNLSLALGSRVLFIDNDVVAISSPDELRGAPAPAFIVYPQYGINSGVFLIEVRTPAELRDAWHLFALLETRAFGGKKHEGDQLFWNHWAREQGKKGKPIFELSRRFNLLHFEDITGCRRPGPCERSVKWHEQMVLWHKPFDYKKWKLSRAAHDFLGSRTGRIDDSARQVAFRGGAEGEGVGVASFVEACPETRRKVLTRLCS